MRRLTVVAVVVAMAMLALAPAAISKGAAANNFVAQLSGANEVPPVATPAHGTAHFHVAKDGTTVSYKVVVNQPQSAVLAAHIHAGPVGVNGPVVQGLFPAPNVTVNKNTTVFSGTFAASPALLALMASGGAYVNVHTAFSPPGEIRGQVG